MTSGAKRRRILPAVALVAWLGLSGAFAADSWAVAIFPSGAEFDLEIAESDLDRARGYMYRDEVGPSEGMLFLFERSGRHSFWMKNCKVSLDIVWLDDAYRVVHIAHDQPPCPAEGDCPSIVPFRAGSYVLEVAGGVARKHGLEVGDQLVILAEPPLGRKKPRS